MWDLIFDWSGLVTRGTDAAAYLAMALVASALFVVKLALSLFGGDADGADFDTDLSHGGSSDASFTFFSVLSILAFFMGAGWMGLACRVNWQMGSLASSLAAAGFGFAMMSFASALSYGTRRLNMEIQYDVRSAIGRTGRVYLSVPPRGEGKGQVEVSVSGRHKVVDAVSCGEAIPAFRDVLVLDVRDDGCLIVEPKA